MVATARILGLKMNFRPRNALYRLYAVHGVLSCSAPFPLDVRRSGKSNPLSSFLTNPFYTSLLFVQKNLQGGALRVASARGVQPLVERASRGASASARAASVSHCPASAARCAGV